MSESNPKKTSIEPLCYGLPEASAATGLGKTLIYDLINKGFIRSRKAGGRRIFLPDELREDIRNLPEVVGDRKDALTIKKAG